MKAGIIDRRRGEAALEIFDYIKESKIGHMSEAEAEAEAHRLTVKILKAKLARRRAATMKYVLGRAKSKRVSSPEDGPTDAK